MKTALVLSFLALVSPWALAQISQEHPTLEGFVTRVASSSDFDVNTIRIVCNNKTASGWSNSDTFLSGCPKNTPKLGEYVTLLGVLHKKQNLLEASRILEHPVTFGKVSGEGVVDAPPIRNPSGFPAGTIMLRADGYWIVLPFRTKISLWDPFRSVEEVNTNTWIQYQGKMRPDGIVVASSLGMMPNVINRRDEHFREKLHYDPASAAGAPKQNSVSVSLTGVDLKRVRPWPDTAMQSRVEKVGSSLIPKYQSQLPASDPMKLAFRFIVVDINLVDFPVPLPDGTVLVPHQAVQRMQNDSQLAALLADAVAAILERQNVRVESTIRTISAGELATYAVYLAVGGPAGLAARGTDVRAIIHHEILQSARVSLMLMHDAGYDIAQAPLAWWILSADKKPIGETEPPASTVELYRTLASVWSQPQPTPPKAN